MNPLNHAIALWIPDCGWYRFDATAAQKILKFLAGKFRPIVINNFAQSWALAQPNAIKQDGNMVACFVVDCGKLGPGSCLVNHGECLEFFY